MKVHLWQSYASNNSSYFRVVAQFKSVDKAVKAAEALEKYYEKNPFRPEWADDVDDFNFDDVGNPEVVAAGSMVAVYHTYTDGMSFAENLPTSLIEKHGGELGEVDERYGVTLQALVKTPAGAKGAAMRKELDAFFKQAETGKKRPPWGKNAPKHWRYETDELLWFRAGETYGCHMTLSWGDEASWMREYFEANGAEHWMYLCDDGALDKIRMLAARPPCPECNNDELSLMIADGKKLTEDQLLGSGCGGMFTIGAIAANAPLSQVGEDRLTRIATVGEDVLIVSANGSIYRSTAGGEFKSVKRHSSSLFGILTLPAKKPGKEVVLVFGSVGTILRSANGGSTFTKVKSDATGYLFHAARTPSGTIFAVGDGMLRSDDAGRSWSVVKAPYGSNQLTCVTAVNDELLYAAGHGGVILRSKDCGQSWRRLASPVKAPFCRIVALDDKKAAIVGDKATILTTTNAGESWTKRKAKGFEGDIEDLIVGNDGRLYAVGGPGKVLISADEGRSWMVEASGSSSHLWGLCTTSSGKVLIVGEDGTLVRRLLDAPADEASSGVETAAPAGPSLSTVGKSFCFTGKLAAMSRAEAKARVKDLGGVAKSSVTKDLDYLVIGDEGSPLFGQGKKGSKMLAAEKLAASGAPVQIISETAFAAMKRLEEQGAAADEPKTKAAVKKAAAKPEATKKTAKKKKTTKKAAKKAKSTPGTRIATVGKNFLFTGKLAAMTRAEAKARVKELGGVAKSSVTKDLDYLVVGDEGSPLYGQGKKGSKILAAEKLVAAGAALQIITERAFMELEREE